MDNILVEYLVLADLSSCPVSPVRLTIVLHSLGTGVC